MQVDQQLTIIMAVYNKAKVIKRALDSILNQKTKYSFKIIIIDDCSTDGTQYIIKDYLAQYPDKIDFYQNTKNMRYLGTVLRGCEMLKTPYWTVLDPDDYWLGQNNINNALNFLETHLDYALYATNAMMVLNTGKELGLVSDNTSIATYDLKTSEYCPYTHTSATFFRNYYTHDNIAQLSKYIGSEYEKALEGDTFRNYWHLNKGKGHYVNITCSVYEIDKNGIYSSLGEVQKNILNMQIFYFCYLFFDKDIKLNFLATVKCYIKKIYSSIFYLEINDSNKKLINDIREIAEYLEEPKEQIKSYYDLNHNTNNEFNNTDINKDIITAINNMNNSDINKATVIDIISEIKNNNSNKKMNKHFYLFKFIPILSIKYGFLVCRIDIFGFIPVLKIRWKSHD